MAKLLSNTRVYGTATVDTQLLVNGTTPVHSAASGALRVAGGLGVAGSGFFGGTITATNFVGNISGTASLASDIAGGTAGQLLYQIAPNDTGFVGPGTAGQILRSNGASAPSYVNTSSLYVGRAVLADSATSTTGNAATVSTQQRGTNANHFLLFVDSNNVAATGENVYTTSSFQINPGTGAITVANSITFNNTGLINALNLGNNNIAGVNNIIISDPGTSEGITWAGGSGWAVYESPDNLSNAAGNLQIVTNSTRRFTFRTDGTFNATGGGLFGGTVTATNFVGSFSGASTQIETQRSTTNAAHYLTFVDSNNASATAETIYTTSSFVVNPGNGRIGIGTTNPRGPIDVNFSDPQTSYFADGTDGILLGHSGANSFVQFAGLSGGAMFKIEYQRATGSLILSNGTGPTDQIGISNTGRVGIGTTSPAEQVHIAGTTGDTRLRISADDGTNFRGFEIRAGTTFKGGMFYRTTEGNVMQLWGPNGSSAAIYVDANNMVKITASTSVHSAATGAFQVAGGIGVGGGGFFGGIVTATNFVGNLVGGVTQVNTQQRTTNAAHYLTFVDSNNSVATAESIFTTSSFVVNPGTGNVGIGTTSPGAKLEIADEGRIRLTDTLTGASTYSDINYSAGAMNISVDAGSTRTGSLLRIYMDGSEAMRIDSSRNVGIGTTSPSYKLDVSGDSFNNSFRVYGNNNSGPAVTIQNNASGGKAWHLISNGSSNADGAGKLQWWNSTDGFTALTLGFNSSNNTTLYTPLDVRGNAIFNAGANTTVQIRSTNAGVAMLRAGLSTDGSQATGALEVTQDGSYGGGISYNGDGTPAFANGEGADRVSFYRLDAGTRTVVFDYSYANNIVSYKGNVAIGSTSASSPLYIQHTNLAAEPYSGIIVKNTDTTGAAYTGVTVDGVLQSHYRFMLNGNLRWQWRVGAGSGVDDIRLYSWTAAADVITVNNSGNAGFGTAPAYRLDVSGTARATSDFRAPIFYDSNNTNYYLDPASGSNLWYTKFTRNTYPIIVINNTEAANYQLIEWTENDAHRTWMGMSGTSMSLGENAAYAAQGFSINHDGTGAFTISNRGSSKWIRLSTGTEGSADFHTLNIRNGDVIIRQNAISYSTMDNTPVVGSVTTNRLHVNGSIQLTGNDDAIVFGRGTSTFLKDEELGFGWGGGWYMTDATWVRVRNNKNIYGGTGTIRTDGDMRAPIFYDQDNTAYYINPAGTTSATFAGNVGIGTTSPSYRLDVDGQICMHDEAQDIDDRFYGGTFLRGWQSFSAGSQSSITYTTDSTSPVGTEVISVSGYVWARGPRLRLDATQNYEVELWVKRHVANTAGTFYFVVSNYDSNGTRISGDGTDWHYPAAFTPSTTWTKYRFVVGPYGGTKNHSSSARYISVGFIANYTAGNDVIYMTGFKCRPIPRYNNDALTIYNNGNIGIGNTAPAERLHVTGNMVATGEITAYYSDRRLKENVLNISNSLEKLLQLNGITYTPNDLAASFGYDKNKKLVGLFADEVEAVLPEAVRSAPFDTDKDGNSISGENYKTIQYEKLVPLLIEAIKEQQQQINELKSKLN